MTKQIYWSVRDGKRLLRDGFLAAEDDRAAMALASVAPEVAGVLKPGKWVTLRVGELVASVDGPVDAGRLKDTMGWGQVDEKLEKGYLFAEPKQRVDWPTLRDSFHSSKELERIRREMEAVMGGMPLTDLQAYDLLRARMAKPWKDVDYSDQPLYPANGKEAHLFRIVCRCVERQVPTDYAPWRIAELERLSGYRYRATVVSDNPLYAAHTIVVSGDLTKV